MQITLPSIVITARGLPLTLEQSTEPNCGGMYQIWLGPILLAEAWAPKGQESFCAAASDSSAFEPDDIWTHGGTFEQRVQDVCDCLVDALKRDGAKRQSLIASTP